jgi:hypothetical protein
MDFIERWLHISPDGGNGASEILVTTAIVIGLISIVPAIRRYFPKSFKEYLEQLGKRESSDRYDN